MRYHLIPVRMAIIKKKKSVNNKCQRGCGEKGPLLHCCWEYKLVQQLWRAEQRCLKKLNIKLSYDSHRDNPGHIFEEKHDLKGYVFPNVHCRAVYNSQDVEAT